VDSLDKLYTFGEDDGGDTVRVPYSIPAI
jgi:hypothetical protein